MESMKLSLPRSPLSSSNSSNRSPLAHKHSSFYSFGSEEDDPDHKSHQVCGKGILDMILRKKETKSRQQIGIMGGEEDTDTKNCLNPALKIRKIRPYTEVADDDVLLQETSSSSEGSDRENRIPGSKSNDSLNSQSAFIQFNPKDLEVSQDDDNIEIAHTPTSGKSESCSSSEPDSSNRNTPQQQFNLHHSHQWRSSLPAVVEEGSQDADDDEEVQSERRVNFAEGKRSQDRELNSEERKALEALRSLVARQQAALTELGEKHHDYQKQLTEHKSMISRLKEEREQQLCVILKLETENTHLKQEVKSLKRDLSDSLFRNAKSKSSQTRPGPASASLYDLGLYQPYKRNMSSESKTKKWDVLYDGGSEASSIPSSRSDVIYSGSDNSNSEYDASERSERRAKYRPNKEEVELFRMRLEAIQRRRQLRKSNK